MGQIEGLPVDYHYYHSPETQAAALAEILRRLLRDGVKPSEIVVLSKLRLENSGVKGTDGGEGFKLIDVSDFIPARSRTPVIQYTTIQAFKGMESKVVVICDVEQVAEEEPQSLLYVGMSRARSLLMVLMHERTKTAVKQLVARKLQEGWHKPL
jgi:superfamily I DNA/RNA helicase